MTHAWVKNKNFSWAKVKENGMVKKNRKDIGVFYQSIVYKYYLA